MPRILVLDDQKERYEILSLLLRGIAVLDYALTTIEAMELAQAYSYDLFFIDLSLEDGHGFNATLALRKDQKYKETPIFIYSAYWDAVGESELKTSGSTEFFPLPFDPDLLRQEVRRYLENH